MIAIGLTGGAIAGSFLATLALRWGTGRSIAHGRSRCDGCGAVVRAHDLVPVASYLALCGRCRGCGAAIDPRQPAMEGTCAAIGALALALHPGWEGLAGALFGWMLATLALLDLDHFWLPDALVLPLGAAGLAAGAAGLSPPLADRIVGGVTGFLLLALVRWSYRRLRHREGLGGGDPKLFGAIGLWLGWHALPGVLLLAAGMGLGWCVLLLARGRDVALADRLPLGTLLALAAWSIWLLAA